ncbi:hypothetical protein PIB30_103993, partial [Stylosanthes scabra]|nr:hypothetical protein [Stylosanthes scabra]
VKLGLRNGRALAQKRGISILAFINLDLDATARSRHLRRSGARSLLSSPLSQAVARPRDLDCAGTWSSLTTSFSRLKGVAVGLYGAAARRQLTISKRWKSWSFTSKYVGKY